MPVNLFTPEDWFKLVRLPGLGPVSILPLLKRSENFDQLRRLARDFPELAFENILKQVDTKLIENDLKWLEGENCHLISIHDQHYPDLLKEINDPPLALFVTGDPQLLNLPQLAIVGSRNPTRSGLTNAKAFAAFLAENGLAITSGLAAGIDAAAHQGALTVKGRTLAVIGTGNDRVYPAANRELARQIAETGAIISEFPPGTGPQANHFPRRNRIISGLSVGTLVIEATLKSGSLITASRALEQGREVFAIPGSIHSPQSKGCHRLIRDGARLVETAEDIIQDLGSQFARYQNADIYEQNSSATGMAGDANELDDDYLKLLSAMEWEPLTTDEIIHLSGFKAGEVSSMLLLLELQGHVSSAPGGRFVRVL